MKKKLSIFAVLCSLCLNADAASMVTTWTGGAGATSGNTYDINATGNWSNGVPTRNPGNQGPDVIFNDAGTVILSGTMVDTSDGGNITVTGNSNVTYGGASWGSKRYEGNITVGTGSVLTCTTQTNLKNSILRLDGTFKISAAVGAEGADGIQVIFGTEGLFEVAQGIWSASSFSLSGLLATIDTDMAAGEYQFVTRTLVSCSSFNGGSVNFGDFTAADGSALTKSSSLMSGNAQDFLGQYHVYQDGNTIKVQYVSTGAAVPEPTTTTLGLLGLAALAMRRRRA